MWAAGRLALALLLLAPGWAGARTLVITHARAVTMTEAGTLEDAVIVIRDGRIEGVGPGLDVPDGAEIIDAGGRWVTPGLVSPASQLGLVEVGSVSDSDDRNASAGELGAGFDVRYALDPNSVLVDMARADGLTRSLVFPQASAERPFLGQGALITLAEGSRLLDVPGVAVFAKLGGSNTGESGRSRAEDWQRLRLAIEKAAGDDGEPPDSDAGALRALASGDRPLAIFTHRESDIRQAIDLAADLELRLVLIGGAEAWRAADALAERDIPVVLDPTSTLPMSFDEFGTRPDNAGRLLEAGVRVAFFVSGADMNYNAGLGLRQAAGIAWSNGLSREQALEAITIEPARIWDQAASYGSIEPGRAGDLVVWDGDPLEPVSAPVHVLVQGRPVSLETRQSALAERYHPHGRHPENR